MSGNISHLKTSPEALGKRDGNVLLLMAFYRLLLERNTIQKHHILYNNPKNDYKLNETLSNHDNIHEGTTAVLDCLPDKLVTECIFATMTNCANKMSNMLQDAEDVNDIHNKGIRCHTQQDNSSAPARYVQFLHCTRKTKLGAAV